MISQRKSDFINIRIKRDTRDNLTALGKKGQSYDYIICCLISAWDQDSGRGPIDKSPHIEALKD